MLSEAPEVFYLHETFCPAARSVPCLPRFERWLYHIPPDHSDEYERRIRPLAELRFPLARAWADPEYRLLRMKYGALKQWGLYRWARHQRLRPLFKDPCAVMAAEWMAETFASQVVIAIRHPGAYCHSVLKQDWWLDFRELAEQPALMDWVAPQIAEDIRRMTQVEHDLVENASYHWKVTHHVIHQYQLRHAENPDWVFVRHEDLANDPTTGFQELCQRLGLTMTQRVRDKILEHANPDAKSRKDHFKNQPIFNLHRSSTDVTSGWKRKLDPEQIARIRRITGDLSVEFYDEASWDPE